MNSKMVAIPRNAMDKKGKDVMVRFPIDLYAAALKKKGQMQTEAAENGDISNISIHRVVLNAVRAFVAE